jgi:hypothetical protein
MSTTNDVYVNVIADVKGFNNLKKGEDSVAKLQNSFEKLGKTLGIGFGAAELVKFGVDAVKAFAADDASAKILANTLGNLGLAFSDTKVEKFITNLSEVNGIAKNDLRDSFQRLVRSTHDTNKAQDLLNLSLDISKGTGKDLTTVTSSLAKAYGGNITSLAKLGTGLSKAELASKDFSTIQGKLSKLFKGDAATAAESYEGKIARLKTSFEEFKITIGKGIVDAFSNLTKTGSVTGFQKIMTNVADSVANIIRGLGVVLGVIISIVEKVASLGGGWVGKITSALFNNSPLGILMQLGKADAAKKAQDALKGTPTLIPFKEGLSSAADHAKYLQSQKDAAAALKAQNAANKAAADNVKLQNAALLLKKASTIFDLNRISINAALISGAKTLSAEDLARLQLKKDEADLQYAIDTKNADAVDGIIAKMNDALKNVMTLGLQVAQIPKAANPFTAVTEGAQNSIDLIKQLQIQVDALNASQSSSVYNPNPYAVPGYVPATSTAAPTVNVQVTLDGQVVGTAVANTITNTQVDNSASGVNPYFQRSGYGTGSLAW